MIIKVYDSLFAMTGLGEEWLVTPEQQVIAVFYDGNLRQDLAPTIEGPTHPGAS